MFHDLFLIPEIFLLPDKHEADIHPDCSDKESIDKQIRYEGYKSPTMVGDFLLNQLIGIDHNKEADSHQGSRYEKPGKWPG